MAMQYIDSVEMKIEFIYELLKSICCDFGPDSALRERHKLALKLTRLSIKDYVKRLKLVRRRGLRCKINTRVYETSEELREKILKLKELYRTIDNFTPFHQDGRYFSDIFPFGYEGMLDYFGIKHND